MDAFLLGKRDFIFSIFQYILVYSTRGTRRVSLSKKEHTSLVGKNIQKRHSVCRIQGFAQMTQITHYYYSTLNVLKNVRAFD
jgi:hypothetical protein